MAYGPAPESAAPALEWLAARQPALGLVINDDIVAPGDGAYFESVNPATGRPLIRPVADCLRDWQLANVYDIYPQWQHRYAAGVTRNTEHVFGLRVSKDTHGGPRAARAPTLRVARLARRRRPLLFGVERRGHPAAAAARRLAAPRPELGAPFASVVGMRTLHSTLSSTNVLRVATYNIHKGVRGVGPRKRLEIHNLVLGIEALDADLVFLQEVRRMNRAEARQFPDTRFGWPKVPQADYLAPDGYEVAYRTNATYARWRAWQCPALALADRRHRPPRRLRSPLRAARPAARAGDLERHRAARRRRPLRPDPRQPSPPGRQRLGKFIEAKCRPASR